MLFNNNSIFYYKLLLSLQVNAIEKVKAVREKIGYPDFILDDNKLDEEYSSVSNDSILAVLYI